MPFTLNDIPHKNDVRPVVLMGSGTGLYSVVGLQSDGSVRVALTSGTVSASVSVANVAITGNTGQVIDIVNYGGYNNFPVIITSGAVSSSATPATSTVVSGIAASATNVLLSATDSNRKGLLVFNNGTTNMYGRFGSAASLSGFSFYLTVSGQYEMPANYSTDSLNGIWEGSPAGSGLITIFR